MRVWAKLLRMVLRYIHTFPLVPQPRQNMPIQSKPWRIMASATTPTDVEQSDA